MNIYDAVASVAEVCFGKSLDKLVIYLAIYFYGLHSPPNARYWQILPESHLVQVWGGWGTAGFI